MKPNSPKLVVLMIKLKMNDVMYKLIMTSILLCISLGLSAQMNDTIPQNSKTFAPYYLLTSYYDTDFNPFKKGTVYIGASLSLEDRSQENTENIFEKIVEGNRVNFNVLVKSGYYINDYAMVGLNVSVFENKFEGTLLKDSEEVESKSIKRGFSLTPNYRTSVPLTKANRISFYTTAGLTFGKSSTLKRDIKNQDEIQKSFADNYNFRIGISPGATFFVMEKFALELQLDVIGYELNIENKTKNNAIKSKDIRHNVDFKLDVFTVKVGLTYYL